MEKIGYIVLVLLLCAIAVFAYQRTSNLEKAVDQFESHSIPQILGMMNGRPPSGWTLEEFKAERRKNVLRNLADSPPIAEAISAHLAGRTNQGDDFYLSLKFADGKTYTLAFTVKELSKDNGIDGARIDGAFYPSAQKIPTGSYTVSDVIPY